MNYLAKLEYNGHAYKGFQRLPNAPSVQGELERALSELNGEPSKIKAAGRTDAGVHALGQRFNFHREKIEDLEKFRVAFNRLLPNDIHIVSLEEVPDDFDARHSSKKKVYSYRFRWGEKDALASFNIANLGYYKFDAHEFEKALSFFVGKHNFQNFTTKPEDVYGFIREIDSIKVDIDSENHLGKATFLGDGFMTYQVRLIMGFALRCARGQEKAEKARDLIEKTPRHIVSFKAPAEGLYLEDVIYG